MNTYLSSAPDENKRGNMELLSQLFATTSGQALQAKRQTVKSLEMLKFRSKKEDLHRVQRRVEKVGYGVKRGCQRQGDL